VFAVSALGDQPPPQPEPGRLQIILAGGCSDACQSNYNQCMRGCDGATQCGQQCRRNYDGCKAGCRD
jgi:hypothetical protein